MIIIILINLENYFSKENKINRIIIRKKFSNLNDIDLFKFYNDMNDLINKNKEDNKV